MMYELTKSEAALSSANRLKEIAQAGLDGKTSLEHALVLIIFEMDKEIKQVTKMAPFDDARKFEDGVMMKLANEQPPHPLYTQWMELIKKANEHH